MKSNDIKNWLFNNGFKKIFNCNVFKYNKKELLINLKNYLCGLDENFYYVIKDIYNVYNCYPRDLTLKPICIDNGNNLVIEILVKNKKVEIYKIEKR